MKKNLSVLNVCFLTLLSSACININNEDSKSSKNKPQSSKLVSNKSKNVDKTLRDQNLSVKVLGSDTLKSKLSSKLILSMKDQKTKQILESLAVDEPTNQINNSNSSDNEPLLDNSLLVGFPLGLVGQQNIFGGVITKVSDKTNQELGGLKLTDLPPLHVRSMIAPDGQGNYVFLLVGCVNNCGENSEQFPLISFPIVGLDQASNMIILDMASIGKELNLVGMLDPNGDYTQLKTLSSVTTGVDFSYSTLVFDVLTTMIPVKADENDTTAPKTEFTVRWYMKLNSAFNPAFEIRTPTEGVGFFQTERSKTSKITRFSISENGSSVHYFIKNVPTEFRATFAGALDNWNKEFQKIIGRELLTYEFVEVDDPRYEDLIPGDIRFNIIEWDLVNKAGYGGLGPSIANQFTGETISANVLIQGPTIIELYTKWFGVSQEVRELRASGLAQEANNVLKSFEKEFAQKVNKFKSQNFTITLGERLKMTVHSQRADLEDPIFKGHFELVPEGVSYQDYMNGYFTEMLEHELGHNLGLRHNFKGNLGAIETGEKGTVSRSIMEYLGRPYRHLNAIGLYDKMAISYGYAGAAPKHLNWFCTDEDQALDKDGLKTKSPECSKSDATSDPFSFWEGRLQRVIDLLLESKSPAAPVWSLEELESNVDEAVSALSGYGLSAEKTMNTWTNFFGKSDRPETANEIKTYVLESFKKKLCDPKLELIIQAKESQEAAELAQKNLLTLKDFVAKKTKEIELFSENQLNCP